MGTVRVLDGRQGALSSRPPRVLLGRSAVVAWRLITHAPANPPVLCRALAQCSVRVKTDPKLMNNPEAQCTAYYLDFFKCADACVRRKPSAFAL